MYLILDILLSQLYTLTTFHNTKKSGERPSTSHRWTSGTLPSEALHFLSVLAHGSATKKPALYLCETLKSNEITFLNLVLFPITVVNLHVHS